MPIWNITVYKYWVINYVGVFVIEVFDISSWPECVFILKIRILKHLLAMQFHFIT